MTGAEIMAAVSFFIGLLGFVAGIWWRIEGKVKAAEDKAGKVAEDLALHRLHTSENYVTKAGMQEQTAQIMRAIEGVGSRIEGLTERMDRVFEQRPTGRRSSA